MQSQSPMTLYSVHLCYSGLNCMRFTWKFSIPCWFAAGISCTNSWLHQPLCQYLVHSSCCYMSGSFCSSKPSLALPIQILELLLCQVYIMMYSTNAACGIPLVSSPNTPIAWLYIWFGKYITNKASSDFMLSKTRRGLSIVFWWFTL